jgi:O-antigen/teichoic acid export membrane protein
MEAHPPPVEPKNFLRGKTGLLVALAAVVVLLVAWPAYRWFFLISFGIGIVVAAILYFWNKHKPVKESSVEHKRPLGLE